MALESDEIRAYLRGVGQGLGATPVWHPALQAAGRFRQMLSFCRLQTRLKTALLPGLSDGISDSAEIMGTLGAACLSRVAGSRHEGIGSSFNQPGIWGRSPLPT